MMYFFFTLFSWTCFGRYSCHLQGEIFGTRIQTYVSVICDNIVTTLIRDFSGDTFEGLNCRNFCTSTTTHVDTAGGKEAEGV